MSESVIDTSVDKKTETAPAENHQAPKEGLQGDTDLVLIPFARPLKYPIRAIWNSHVRHNAAFHAFLQIAKEFRA